MFQNFRFLQLLGVLCVCEDIPVVENQNYITDVWLKDDAKVGRKLYVCLYCSLLARQDMKTRDLSWCQLCRHWSGRCCRYGKRLCRQWRQRLHHDVLKTESCQDANEKVSFMTTHGFQCSYLI